MLDGFFKSNNIAIIGVSREENKIGRVIFESLLSKFNGNIYPINPNAEEILGYRCYPSIKAIKEKIDLEVIAVPANIIIISINDCIKKKVKNIIIVSAGFKETGNSKLEKRLKELLLKHKINAIGPNCLGIFDASTGLDTLFLPVSRLKRPKRGNISFICQSGAIGSAMLDLIAGENIGISKFISYGNATVIDESDIIEYLANDKSTDVICAYIEGANNGKKFFSTLKKTAAKKPLIIIKAGITKEGHKATLSHTGSLAGSSEVYNAVFKQNKVIKADSLQEIIDYAKIFANIKKIHGNKVQIITNGGGFGIISTDSIINNNLKLACLSKKTTALLKKSLPKTVIISNPIDLTGDADNPRYKLALSSCLKDKNVDVIFLIILFQTPLVDENIVQDILSLKNKKPIVVVSAGDFFTRAIKQALEENNIPTYAFPENAASSIRKLLEYKGKK